MKKLLAGLVLAMTMACGQGVEGLDDSGDLDTASRTDGLATADLRLSVSGANTTGANTPYSVQFTTSNLTGGLTAQDVAFDVPLPAGATLLSSTANRCALNGQTLHCVIGALGFRSTGTVISLSFANSQEVSLTGRVTTTTPDFKTTDDVATLSLAVTSPGVAAVMPASGGTFRMLGCNGVSSFAQCTPASYVKGLLPFAGNGTLTPAIYAGSSWTQSAAQTDLSLVIYRNGVLTNLGDGVAVTSNCFDGQWRYPSGVVYGAFRLCF